MSKDTRSVPFLVKEIEDELRSAVPNFSRVKKLIREARALRPDVDAQKILDDIMDTLKGTAKIGCWDQLANRIKEYRSCD